MRKGNYARYWHIKIKQDEKLPVQVAENELYFTKNCD